MFNHDIFMIAFIYQELDKAMVIWQMVIKR